MQPPAVFLILMSNFHLHNRELQNGLSKIYPPHQPPHPSPLLSHRRRRLPHLTLPRRDPNLQTHRLPPRPTWATPPPRISSPGPHPKIGFPQQRRAVLRLLRQRPRLQRPPRNDGRFHMASLPCCPRRSHHRQKVRCYGVLL
jgi:hypothetical protein